MRAVKVYRTTEFKRIVQWYQTRQRAPIWLMKLVATVSGGVLIGVVMAQNGVAREWVVVTAAISGVFAGGVVWRFMAAARIPQFLSSLSRQQIIAFDQSLDGYFEGLRRPAKPELNILLARYEAAVNRLARGGGQEDLAACLAISRRIRKEA